MAGHDADEESMEHDYATPAEEDPIEEAEPEDPCAHKSDIAEGNDAAEETTMAEDLFSPVEESDIAALELLREGVGEESAPDTLDIVLEEEEAGTASEAEQREGNDRMDAALDDEADAMEDETEAGDGEDVAAAAQPDGGAEGSDAEAEKPEGGNANGAPPPSPIKVKRPLSAWMHFLAATREQVRSENPGMPIGEMQKILSAKWKALDPTERATFDATAAEDKARFQAELKAAGLTKLPLAGGGASTGAGDAHPAHSGGIVLPLARVRKIIKLDSDVGNISKEGLQAVTKATELFIAQLAERSWGLARQTGRKGVRPRDLADYIGHAQEMYFLREEVRELLEAATAAAAEGSGGGKVGGEGGSDKSGSGEKAGAAKSGAKGGRGRRAVEQASGRAAISSFFAKVDS